MIGKILGAIAGEKLAGRNRKLTGALVGAAVPVIAKRGLGTLALVARLHPLPPAGVDAYIPRGRYMFWAMLPAIWLLALGLQQLAPARWRSHSLWGLVAVLAVSNLTALATLVQVFS